MRRLLDEFWAPLVGAILWLVWSIAVRPGWVEVVLVLSPLVLVPLGLRLAAQPRNGPVTPLARHLQEFTLPAGLLVAVSFLTEPGALAAFLVLPWFVFTVAVALVGAMRLGSRTSVTERATTVDVGLMFLAVGGGWLVFSRAGLEPLGFSSVIVRLTAVHFHYAGFILPLVAGIVCRRQQTSSATPLAAAVGVPVVAAGIIVGGTIELVAAWAMAAAGLAVAWSIIELSRHEAKVAARTLKVAAASLGIGMVLAAAYAVGVAMEMEFLTIDRMVRSHGTLNGLGFGLLALIGLSMTDEDEPPIATRNAIHLGRPREAFLRDLQMESATTDTTNTPGLLNREQPKGFRRDEWIMPTDDFDLACEALWNWAGHEAAGVTVYPARPRIARGETLAIAIPFGPVSVSAACMIVDIINEDDRYGFVYSTLPHHPLSGEESIIVSNIDHRPQVTVTSVWQRAGVASRLCPPVTRFIQSRVVGRYLRGIADAEVASVGAYLESVMNDVDNREFPALRSGDGDLLTRRSGGAR